jgi:flavin reductase (DIM6/NTAB) family NADH-FMN oxidoreductase RutF
MKRIVFTLLIASVMLSACKEKTEEKVMEKESSFKTIEAKDLNEKVIKTISEDWLLLTAGKENDFNMMTCSWGMLGNLWNEPVCMIFVRPQRYTYEFMEKNDYFTICVFDTIHRDILNFCGSKSGRDYDKVKETGLKPLYTKHGNVYYQQARLVIECQKIYADRFEASNFIDTNIMDNVYKERDFHKMYVGKIISVMVKQ